jgi:hypothetical protein
MAADVHGSKLQMAARLQSAAGRQWGKKIAAWLQLAAWLQSPEQNTQGVTLARRSV